MEMSQYFRFSPIIMVIFLISACSEDRTTLTVTKADITESVYSSITLEPEFLYSVYSELPGRIIEFKKETGDSVLFGDIICTIDAVGAIKNSENAALNLQLIQNQLSGDASVIDDLDEEIGMAQQQLSIDSIQMSRMIALQKKGLASEAEYEQANLKLRSSKTRLEALIARKKRLARELKIQQQQARNAYESALSTSSDATVKSVVDGLVYEVFKENGELVNAQQPIAVIGSNDDYIIRMLIDEVDITKVSKGQEVRIDLEAYPGKNFIAKVDQIYPKMDPQTQSFEVIAIFVEAPSKLYLGLTGEANVIVSEAKNRIVIPRDYLIDGNSVETQNGIKKIKIGLKNLTSVEVLDGLTEGEIIYLPEE